MKKLIFLLFTVTFIVVSFLSIKQFEYLQFQTFNKNDKVEEWNLDIESGISQNNKLENFQLLKEAALEANVNLQRVSYEKDKNGESKIVYYVVINDFNKYFEKHKLKYGDFLDRNSDSKDFLSTVNTNNKYQVGQLEIFHSFDPIEIRPMIAAAKKRDIKGTYTVPGKENAERLNEILLNYGFKVGVSKDLGHSLITNYPYQDMINKALLILCLLIALAMLYDTINNYKEIAVRLMLGHNFWQVGIYLFKKYIKIFLSSFAFGFLGLLVYLYVYNQHQQLILFLQFLLKRMVPLILILSIIFIVTWLSTLTINISQMIKNKKPIQLLFLLNLVVRFIISIFLVLGLQQGISTFLQLKSTVDTQEKWALLHDYSYLGIIAESNPGLLSFLYEENERENFQEFYKEIESQGAFLIIPSAYYLYNSSDIPLNANPWGMDGRKVEINNNYLSLNPIIDINNNLVSVPEDFNSSEITVIVPIKYKKHESDIRETLASDYNGIYNLKDKKPVRVNIKYVKNNQSYFTYSPNMAENNDFEIIDPIAVIVNNKFDPLILGNHISMGYGFYTKNSGNEYPFSITLKTLKKYDLDEIWQPISVAYSTVELKIANDKDVLQLSTVYCILFLLLGTILLFFSSMYYLEINKHLLLLQWIFGYSFFEKHNLVYLVLLVFWNFVFMICFFNVSDTLLLTKITLGLAIFDVLLMSLILILKEYPTTKKLLLE